MRRQKNEQQRHSFLRCNNHSWLLRALRAHALFLYVTKSTDSYEQVRTGALRWRQRLKDFLINPNQGESKTDSVRHEDHNRITVPGNLKLYTRYAA